MADVARSHIREEPSPYYPPRARWYAPLFYLGNALRRRLELDRLTMPPGIKIGGIIAGFFVPGLAVWLRGPKLWGQAALLVSACLILFFIVRLGFPAANIAFGLLVSLHASGFVYYCSPWLAKEPFAGRLGFTFLALLAIWLLVYLPEREFVQGNWLTPLRLRGQVMVVQRIISPGRIRRGDWIAYHLKAHQTGEAHDGGAVWAHAGMSCGPVLAVAGDQITFSTNRFTVNGLSRTNLPHMPTSGEFIVPENHWFIWPDVDISGHGNVGEASISAAMSTMADVSERQFFGRPFHRWFWRQQISQ